MDGSVEGWKGGRMEGMSLSEPRITQDCADYAEKREIRGNGWKDGRMEGMSLSEPQITQDYADYAEKREIRRNGWKDGRMEGMSLSEPRITQDCTDYADKKDCGLESFVKEENGSVRNRAYQGWCKNRGLEFPSTEEKITNPKM